MNRLTYQKRDGNYSIRFDLGNLQQVDIKAMNKLGKLEDIEEELGIDLITLFKALKNGIYKKGRNNLKGLILYSKMPMFSFYHKTIDAELIEDYGKTWALTKEELENETFI